MPLHIASPISRLKKQSLRREEDPPEGDCAIYVLTVDYRIKVRLDLQANKSSVVVKGPFFP
jgi:hypothetical protein